MRNALIVRSAEAVIAIGGGAGTLSEIGFAAKIKRRIIGLKTFSVSLNDEPVPLLIEAKTPAEAVALALK
jgi:predicted Rossmann-fold nucleotide-binding protein